MRERWRFAWVVVAAVQLVSVAVAQQVLTESGAISGVHETGTSVYKGVPFAAPPVGELRWRPPVRVASWTGTRKADAFAPACTQVGVSMPGETPPAISEDCLYLNIWTPGKSKARSRAPACNRLDIRGRLQQRVGCDASLLGRPARAQRRDRRHHRISAWSTGLSCAPGPDASPPTMVSPEYLVDR